MNKIKLFQENDAESLYSTAKYLYLKTHFWSTYLTTSQLQVFNKVFGSNLPKSQSKLLWNHLINGNIVIKDEEHRSIDSALLNSKATCLRIRSLLWGKATSYYYNLVNHTNDRDGGEIFDILEDDDSDFEDASSEHHQQQLPQQQPSKPIRDPDEDDDYDDDDDEEEQQGNKDTEMKENDQTKETKPNDQSVFEYYEKSLILDLIGFTETTSESDSYDSKNQKHNQQQETRKSQSGKPQTNTKLSGNPTLTTSKMSTSLNSSDTIVTTQELEIIKNMNSVYHNFENDKETLMKREKLEANDKIVDQQLTSKLPSSEIQSLSNQLSMNIGSANLSLKYLLKLIDNNKDRVPNLTNRELTNLIHDVKKSKSKWSSDDRIGQEELYEACEKVVTELRGYTQHSTPFLTKVSKREAPNYYQIIKKPMDLNTVMKKLKNLDYKSKNDFLSDLMLIWTNCLTYNTDPAHQLRKDALAMRKKTQSLTPLIPDITIRTKAEMEKEEKELEQQMSQRKNQKKLNGGKGLKRTSNGTVLNVNPPDSASPQPTPTPNQSMLSTAAANTPEPSSSVGANDEDLNESQADLFDNEVSQTPHDDDIDQENDFNEEINDLEVQVWKNYTSKLRGDFLLRRSKLFIKDENNELKLNSNAEAVLRDSTRMSEFMRVVAGIRKYDTEEDGGVESKQDFSKQWVSKEKKSKLENAADIKLSDNDHDENGIDDDLYLTEYDIINGIPVISYQGEDENELSRKENKILERLNFQRKMNGSDSLENGETSDFVPPKNGLNKIVVENITEMQDIRKICFKISLIRRMQNNQIIHHTQLKAPAFERLKDLDLNPLEKESEQVVFDHKFNSTFIYDILKKNVGKVLMNTGFEAADPHAIEVITQIAENFMGNLIRTIKLHLETSSQNRILSKSDILLLSLVENGISKPDDLFNYVKDGIFKQNSKLKELRQKLSNFLKELLRPTLLSFQTEKDLMNEKNFTDNSDQFLTGDFSNELGEDFFGFRELGLDKEFHMLSSSIPLHLLNSRLNNSLFNSQNANAADQKLIEEFDKNVKYERLTKADIGKQIGLASPFLKKFFEKSKVVYLKNFKNNNTTNKELPLTNKEEEMLILEDEDMPQKQRNIRPRLPPNGKISGVKRRTVGNGFFLNEDDAEETHVFGAGVVLANNNRVK